MHKSNLLIAVEFFSLKLYAGNGRTNERTHRIPLKPSKTNDIFLCLFAETAFQASLARYGRYTLYVYVSECVCVCVCGGITLESKGWRTNSLRFASCNVYLFGKETMANIEDIHGRMCACVHVCGCMFVINNSGSGDFERKLDKLNQLGGVHNGFQNMLY